MTVGIAGHGRRTIVRVAATAVTMLGVGAAAVAGSGAAQAAAPQDCSLQRDTFGASAHCPVGEGWIYELAVECFGLNMPFGKPPAIEPYSQKNSTLAMGPNVSASCLSGGAIFGVVTNAYVTPQRLWRG